MDDAESKPKPKPDKPKFKDRFHRWKNALEQKVAWFVPARVHPNHLTSLRIALILLLPVAASYGVSTKAIFWLVIMAGVSDVLDGITARQRRQITPLGTTLDPIADKLFALVCFLILWRRDLLSSQMVVWLLIVEGHVVLIPVLSFAYRLLGHKPDQSPHTGVIRPGFFGKAKMTTLIIGIGLMFLGEGYASPVVLYIGRVFIYAALILGGMALINYVLDWVNDKY